jgi:hypothetical protein
MEILKAVEHEQLKDFVADYLDRDLRFKASFSKAFRPKNSADSKGEPGSPIVALSSKPKAELHPSAKPAFEAAKGLYEILRLNQAEDAWLCLGIIDSISDLANTRDDRIHIFDNCLELLDKPLSGFDCESKLLGICANLLARDNLTNGATALCMRADQPLGEKFLELLRDKTDALEKSDDQLHFISAKYEIAMGLEDKKTAEDMCLKALAFGIDTQKWLLRLYALYEEKGSDIQMAPVAESILFTGRPEFYNKLKAHLKNLGIWEKERSDLISRCAQLPQYLEILEQEQDWERLLTQVRKRPALVYQYGPILASYNRIIIKTIYHTTILDEAYSSSKPENYESVCSHLEDFSNAGFANDAEELARNTRETFRRKSAFVEELNRFLDRNSRN